jgi:glycogen(starch) synthase
LDAVVRELREDRRGRAWRFRIVGAGTNPNTFPALQIGSDRGVDVELMGELGFDDTIRAIATADSVIVPSRAESFGMVALEAGACAVPAVASRVGGLCDIIEDGVTGLLVSPDDVEGFVTGLVMAATESGAAWGRGARHRVERLYDSRLVASRFVEVAAGAK